MSLLSPLQPILRNGNPLPKFLGNAFTGERILQRPTPRHRWATDRPKMRYQTFIIFAIFGIHSNIIWPATAGSAESEAAGWSTEVVVDLPDEFRLRAWFKENILQYSSYYCVVFVEGITAHG